MPGVPRVTRVPWYLQILADQLTLSQPGADYALQITTCPHIGFLDLPSDLLPL